MHSYTYVFVLSSRPILSIFALALGNHFRTLISAFSEREKKFRHKLSQDRNVSAKNYTIVTLSLKIDIPLYKKEGKKKRKEKKKISMSTVLY